MSESLEQRLARMGDEAEAGEADQTMRPLPPNVTVTGPKSRRPARGRVLQIRFTDAEMTSFEKFAAAVSTEATSTVARDLLLGIMKTQSAPLPNVAVMAEHLATLANQLRDAVKHTEEPTEVYAQPF